MSGFQVLGIGLSLLAAVLVATALWRRRITSLTGLFWLFAWSAAAVAIAFPQLTVLLARALGIQRGADLVFYCSILAMMAGFFLVYVRLRRLEADLTRLSRYLAIRDAQRPAQEGMEEASPGGDTD